MMGRVLEWLGPPRPLAEDFRQETARLVLARLRVGSVLALVFIPAFLLVDSLRMPDRFGEAVLMRGLGTVALLVLLPFTLLERLQPSANRLAVLGLAIISATVCAIGRLGTGAGDPIYLVQAMAIVFVIMGAGLLFPVDGRTMLGFAFVPLGIQLAFSWDYDLLLNLPILSSSAIAMAIAAVGARSAFRHRLGDYDGRRAREDLLDARSELVAVLTRDLAAREEAETVLRRSEQKYRALFEDLKDVVLLVSRDERILDVNPAGLALFGFNSREECLATPIVDLYFDPQRDRPRLRASIRSQGFLKDCEVELRRRDGQRLQVLLTSTLLRDEEGNVTGARLLVRDVTEQRLMEARLRQAQKLEAVGLLAAGVAHEINNPLTYVLTDLELLREGIERLPHAASDHDREKLQTTVHEAQEGAERVRRIVRDLKTFSRMDEEPRTSVDLNQVLQKTIGIASSEIRYRARLHTDLGELPAVLASEGRLTQVFLNLLLNAVQSFGERTGEQNEIFVRTFTDDGEAVVEIQDTGCGIVREHLEKLFDPFFTTKPVGIGSGLGLSICYNILRSHGGRIEVESEPGCGSRFVVRLPGGAESSESRARDAAPERLAAQPGRGRILIIDDEPRVLATAKLILEREHDVIGASSGREALEMLDHPAAVDVILCDLMMREISGMDLYERLRERAPDLAGRMVFMTGGAFTRAASDFLGRIPNPHIEKPFRPADLLSLVGQVIAGVRLAVA